MKEKKIDIAKDFGPFVSGRTRQSGPFSAEALRDDYLIPALKEYDRVILKIDSLNVYTYAFWEECFVDFPKRTGMDAKTIRQKLTIEYGGDSEYEEYEEAIWEYIEDSGDWKEMEKVREFEAAQEKFAAAQQMHAAGK